MRGEGLCFFAFMVQMNHLCRCGRPAEAPPATLKPSDVKTQRVWLWLARCPSAPKASAHFELLVGQWPNKAMLTLLKKLGI